MKNNYKEYFKDFILPSYDEGSIFLLNFTFILLFIFNNTCRDEILSFYSPPASADSRGLGFAVIATLIYLGGVFASIIHVFIKGEKEIIAETLMKASAMVVIGIAGIASGVFLLKNNINWVMISPIWNIVMGVILLYQLGFIESVNFDQKDSSFSQIIFGVLTCIGLFLFLNIYCEYYWALTFSICVNYIIGFNHFFSKGPSYLKNHLLLTHNIN